MKPVDRQDLECFNAADLELERIARDGLGIPTMSTRHSDALDFHDLAVWNIRTTLSRAYHAGRNSALRRQQEGDNTHA